MITQFRYFSIQVILFACFSLLSNGLLANSFDIRALWIVRDDMVSKNSIDKILLFAKENNYNHLFVQVRGRGDAYYSSRIVPRSHLLAKTEFDPLKYIIKQARYENIAIHAWINLYYLWSSSVPPSQSDHLLFTHPEWLDTKYPDNIKVQETLDAMSVNRKKFGEGFYLSPTHPEVDAHLQHVVTELIQNYKLDGIHFDYIRYHASGWGLNPVGLKMYLNQSVSVPGLPGLKVKEKISFDDFKRKAITNFIKKASTRIKAYQPYCIVSAAVKPNLYSARNEFCQEWDVWLSGRYIDWAVPMNYASNIDNFDRNIQIIKDNIPEQYMERIIMGIAVYNQKPRSAGQKIYYTGKSNFGGISIFSYTVFKNKPSYSNKIIKYLN